MHRDDVSLLALGEVDWLRVILELDWPAYRPVAAQYYQSLREFNSDAARERAEARGPAVGPGKGAQGRLALLEECSDDDGDPEILETRETRE